MKYLLILIVIFSGCTSKRPAAIPKFHLNDPVKVTSGFYLNQRGIVYEYNPPYYYPSEPKAQYVVCFNPTTFSVFCKHIDEDALAKDTPDSY